jgi:hypothetical protein
MLGRFSTPEVHLQCLLPTSIMGGNPGELKAGDHGMYLLSCALSSSPSGEVSRAPGKARPAAVKAKEVDLMCGLESLSEAMQ